MQAFYGPSLTTSSSAATETEKKTAEAETEVNVAQPALQSPESADESESKLDESETPPQSPASTKASNLLSDLEAENSESQSEVIILKRSDDIVAVEKKDASTQTEIFATETNINPMTLSSCTGTGKWNTGGLPYTSGQNSAVSGMENSDHEPGLPDVNSALNHTVFNYNNLTFMNDNKSVSNDECASDLNQGWYDTASTVDCDEDKRDIRQNPHPCHLPNDPNSVSPAQWYQPPVPVPCTQSTPQQMQTPPAYQYYPPYGNNGMYYNNRAACGCHQNNMAGTQGGHNYCNENERPHWWNMNGRRWPESRDDLCSYGCGRRRRCRREFYVEAPRPRPRPMPAKTYAKETNEATNAAAEISSKVVASETSKSHSPSVKQTTTDQTSEAASTTTNLVSVDSESLESTDQRDEKEQISTV